ncbi:hypothetical protein KSP40_PGU020022 [Platanthera guangdongensis]|uniref:Uncharacterized protein n=1 Tax=Platanthera guangdongensis TaxID=2320717 RepID=A0ABR2N4D9_9ASPA
MLVGEMESSPSSFSFAPAVIIGSDDESRILQPQVDSFLVEALENPRHRLTMLRMELDIQRFMQSSDQCQFEFQHFPTSYLRCAAHRVAQHYGLQTLVVENMSEGSGSKIIVRKTPESRYPAICLSDIPTKQPENEQKGQFKIVIRPRPSKASQGDEELGNKSTLRTVEERKEDYDKARARIFNGSFNADHGFFAAADGRSYFSSGGDEREVNRNVTEEQEKIGIKDSTSRVAIFRDREKDLTDPDYDRSYDRYSRGFVPCNNFSIVACNVLQPSHIRYEGDFSQLGYRPADPSTLNAFGAVGCNQTSPNAVYIQWPTPAMMYAQSYEHFRHAVFPAPVYQQPLSFENLQNS